MIRGWESGVAVRLLPYEREKGAVMPTDLNGRLDSLERSLARQRRLSLCLAGALVALTTLAAAEKIAASRAGSFTLEDRQGKARATLALDEGGNPALSFMTPEGIVTRAIGAHDETPARLAELERVVNSIPRVQPQAALASDTQGPPQGPSARGADDQASADHAEQMQRQQVLDSQRQAARAQEQLRIEQDQRRQEAQQRVAAP